MTSGTAPLSVPRPLAGRVPSKVCDLFPATRAHAGLLATLADRGGQKVCVSSVW